MFDAELIVSVVHAFCRDMIKWGLIDSISSREENQRANFFATRSMQCKVIIKATNRFPGMFMSRYYTAKRLQNHFSVDLSFVVRDITGTKIKWELENGSPTI